MLPLGDIILCDDDGNELNYWAQNTEWFGIEHSRWSVQGARVSLEWVLRPQSQNYIWLRDLQSYNGLRTWNEKRCFPRCFVNLLQRILLTSNWEREWNRWVDIEFQANLKEEKGSKPFYDISGCMNGDSRTTNSYVDVSSRVKKNNITVDNIASIMLSQIPELSAAVANAVMSKYGTLKNLIDDLTSNPNALEDIMIPTKTNKVRKISKTSTQNIYCYLVAGEKQEVILIQNKILTQNKISKSYRTWIINQKQC